jgi:glycosyltransferase involved in cell wall biosynthesis
MVAPDLVSVVIPCYKQAHYLSEAIESVLAQGYPHHEIVVVDDGSPDNVSEVVARYPAARCIRQENQGPSAARNAGMRESRGEYVVFLDSDDRLLPNALEAGVKALKEHPECAFVSGQYRLIDAQGAPLPDPQRYYVEKDHYLELLRANYVGCPAAVMYRRRVFEYVSGFDTALRSAEDYDVYLRIARRFPVHCHREVVAEYRRHGVSASHNYERMLKCTLTVLQAQRDYVRGNARYERAYEQGIKSYRQLYHSAQLVEEVRSHARADQWGPALRGMWRLLRHYPLRFLEEAGRKMYCAFFGAKS